MADNIFKLGTYKSESDAKSAQSSGQRLASKLSGCYDFHITQATRGWVVTVRGSRVDIIAFQNKWS